jgi:hypothetical protein
MALPTKGAWSRTYGVNDYTGTALVWGTGVNNIHYYYGSPADRLTQINPREGDHTPPYASVPEQIVAPELWGYQPEDSFYTGVNYDARPPWDTPPEDEAVRAQTPPGFPPMNAGPQYKNQWRGKRQGAFRWHMLNFLNRPSETVTEGWRNKPKGEPADARTSDPKQYETQTSMQQRYRTRNNMHAQMRGTDAARSNIQSRVIGQKKKIYSTGERSYDMLPREQDAERARPFWYRTAGTGPEEMLGPNEQMQRLPVDRTPPPDPYIGVQDTDQSELLFGYTPEDRFYA